ncbi:tetratricopeptide repeat protein [Dactylosporangium sucinum]|uniref:Tetratricopeptide repeat protein n=1 Tax=Dactylosporangium sucinum TaxID=1424081 RepID=A0A917UHT0_9ACTN|nr:tetratricopeptide repeat protein [Dactylosporangium sucinum]GGM88457.1 hypothetical protein GCM10007977_108080 [Dactylosporangium sucinum]
MQLSTPPPLPNIVTADPAEAVRLLRARSAQLLLEQRWEEALADAEQALRLQRLLVNADPLRQLPVLVEVLNGVSAVLAGLGRAEEAVAASEEAVGLGRRLVHGDPGRYRWWLASSLHELGLRLADQGRPADALTPAMEALDLFQDDLAAGATGAAPFVADAFESISARLVALGMPAEAEATLAQAVQWRRHLAGRDPVQRRRLGYALHNLGNLRGADERWAEALAAYDEALPIFRTLAADAPDEYLPNAALTANNRIACTMRLADWPRALPAIEDAIAVVTELLRRGDSGRVAEVWRLQDAKATVLDRLSRTAEAAELRRGLHGTTG